MKGIQLIEAAKIKFGIRTDKDLSEKLGVSIPTISLWKKQRREITPQQMAGLLNKASEKATSQALKTAIHPIVEFFGIDRCLSRGGKNSEIFSSKKENGDDHSYLSGLKEELENNNGIYIFFDSVGKAIYAGKARKQSLWKEMNRAFNRRRDVQTIRCVKHPMDRERIYRTSDVTHRQIVKRQKYLWHIASYFSAYRVVEDIIDNMEAMLLRSFPNNLLNEKMEQFASHRKTDG